MPDIKERLSQDIANIPWKDLLPHAKRDAVIVVSEKLNLLDVGAAIAQDHTAAVSTWIANKFIAKPSAQQLTVWNRELDKQFTTLIVQPFVIVQEN
ncbi:MAG: DUF2288 domain-containing protein [Pleurocapsa sp.]